MNIEFRFTAQCGETTCASEPGRFCRFLQVHPIRDGNCELFGKVFEEGGWIQRHRHCLRDAIVVDSCPESD